VIPTIITQHTGYVDIYVEVTGGGAQRS